MPSAQGARRGDWTRDRSMQEHVGLRPSAAVPAGDGPDSTGKAGACQSPCKGVRLVTWSGLSESLSRSDRNACFTRRLSSATPCIRHKIPIFQRLKCLLCCWISAYARIWGAQAMVAQRAPAHYNPWIAMAQDTKSREPAYLRPRGLYWRSVSALLVFQAIGWGCAAGMRAGCGWFGCTCEA